MQKGYFSSKEVSDAYIWDAAKLPKSAASLKWMELKEKKQLILLLNTIKHSVLLLKMCSKMIIKTWDRFAFVVL